MELTIPTGFFDRFCRWIGIVKSINIINNSKCNLKIDQQTQIAPNEMVRVSIHRNRLSVFMFLDHKWYSLYKNQFIDKGYDIVIDNRHINFVNR